MGFIENVNNLAQIDSEIKIVDTNKEAIINVSDNIDKVTTVANDLAAVMKVAEDLNETISEIETVANGLNLTSSNIELVADNITSIVNTSDNITPITTIANSIESVNLISESITSLNALSDELNKISVVFNNISQINIVEDYISEINTLAINIETLLDMTTGHTFNETEFTGNEGQTNFGFNHSDSSYLTVHYNGRLLSSSDWTASNGTLVTLVDPVNDTGDEITIRAWDRFKIIDSSLDMGTL